MNYDFDTLIERRGTGCLKYDSAAERGKPTDALPLWVADMDFTVPPGVVDALKKRAEHGIFGYSAACSGYFESVQSWYETRFNWSPDQSWLVQTPGIVFALATAVRAYTQVGESVLIQPPVYYPFKGVIESNHRKVAQAPLIYADGAYTIDFEAFEDVVVREKVRLFLLCNPHNPVGRVWTRRELQQLGEICLRHQVIVVSDEIHSDFVYPGHQHTVFSSIRPEFAECSIICTSPGKTFNLASLQVSNIFIPDPALRKLFTKAIGETGYSQLNTMGLIACQASYETGGEWVDQLKVYLEGNYTFIRSFLAQKLPQLHLIELQGTYLVWIDCRALNLSDEALEQLVEQEARLWVDMGTMFGKEGAGFIRINIACPRSIIETACTQLEAAIARIAAAQ